MEKREKHIDAKATIERARAKYGSILQCCRVFDCSPHLFYMAVNEARGTHRRATKSPLIIKRLESEGLLVSVHGATMRERKTAEN